MIFTSVHTSFLTLLLSTLIWIVPFLVLMVFTTLAIPADSVFSNLVSISQVRLNELEERGGFPSTLDIPGVSLRDIVGH
jgi:hypothetical protein